MDSGASGSSSGSGSGGNHDGMGMLCPTLTHVVSATKLTMDSTWPMTLAVDPGMGKVNIVILSTYDIDSQNHITGKTQTCQSTTPAISLNAIGQGAVGAPGPAQVAIQLPSSTWDAPTMPKFDVTGTLGGWHVGASFVIDPVTTLAGLSPTSPFAKADAVWPMSGTQLMPSDIVDDDTDGHPGITSIPRSATTTGMADSVYYVPKTATSNGRPTDKLYLVLRTELSLSGTNTSCTEGAGTANVTQLNNHVVGCEVSMPPMTDCTPDEYNYIDSNTTVYAVMSGTYATKQLTAATPTCDDAVAAFP
jgi:hypothetical protein